MRLIDALNRIRQLNEDVVYTHDVSALLKIDLQNASKMLSRLADSGEVIKIARGIWGIHGRVDPFILVGKLTTPFPSYISLQTALYHHGMISQIPTTIYLVSLARSKNVNTPIASYSIHHIVPDLFTGFRQFGPKKIAMATPEKALFDLAYFSRTKIRYFSTLSELEIPENLDKQKLQEYISLISNKRIASAVDMRLHNILLKSTLDIPSRFNER